MDKVYMDAIETVISYAGDVTDWLVIKKEVLKRLKSSDRKVFSTRHPKSKKHTLNDFELEVIRVWKELTGNTLELAPEKRHDD